VTKAQGLPLGVGVGLELGVGVGKIDGVRDELNVIDGVGVFPHS
jgi:hypothetical protein